jgi:ABC-type Zn2+ transport system substrate-binding protein/surface adhesin
MELRVSAVRPEHREIIPAIHLGGSEGNFDINAWLSSEQARELALKLMAKAIEVEA